MRELCVVGAGSWGTALAIVLAPRFERVRLWAYDPGLAGAMRSTRENSIYLPGFVLPGNVEPTDDMRSGVGNSGPVLLVVPSQHLGRVFRQVVPLADASRVFVSATKGIEIGTLRRMTEVMRDEAAPHFNPRLAVLSGPTFAREVANGEPAVAAIASEDPQLARELQTAFSGPTFRLYTNTDVAGVEVGAALKNVIAIGAGIAQGLGLGSNTIAALVTRGLAEITRLAVAMGGQPRTLAGLAGLGDLLLTCTGDLSRNRRVGIELAKGRTLEEILGSTKMVAEGVETTAAAVALARRHRVEMPIAEQMFAVLHEGKAPKHAVRCLMERSLKDE